MSLLLLLLLLLLLSLLLLLLPLLSSLGRNLFLLIIRVVESDAWSVLLIAKQAFLSNFFFATAGRPEFRQSLVFVAGVVGGGRDVSRMAAYSAG